MTSARNRRWVGVARALLAAVRGRSARRVQWGVVDQGVSSLTNFVIALVVARAVGLREFGAFSLAFTLYVFFLWGSRSLATEAFVVRLTAASPTDQRAAARQVSGTALAIGAVLAAAGALAGAVDRSSTGRVLMVMALSMPGLLVQDVYRYVLFVAGKPRSAAVNDVLWLTVQSALVLVLVVAGQARGVPLVAAFGLSAGVSAVVGGLQTGVVPRPRAGWRWVHANRDLAVPFVLELLAITGMIQLALVAVAVILGVAAVGQLRAAMLLLGPLTVVFLGLFVIGVPEAVRLRQRSRSAFLTAILGLGVGMPLVAFLWTAGLLLVPDHVGLDVLRANWTAARQVLVPVAVLTAGHSCALAAIVGLRALGAARQSLRARLWGAPVFLGGGVIGAWAGGAYGAGVGLAVGAWLDAVVAWVALRWAFSAHDWRSVDTDIRPELAPFVV